MEGAASTGSMIRVWSQSTCCVTSCCATSSSGGITARQNQVMCENADTMSLCYKKII